MSQGNRPIVGRNSPFTPARTKTSASGPGDRIASVRDIAIYFREDCRTLRDALQLEMVVAQYGPRISDVLSTAGVPVGEAIGLGVVAELERHGDALSQAILRGVAHIAVGQSVERSAAASARLAERGIQPPPKFAGVARASACGAWRTSEGAHVGEYVLFAEFDQPRSKRHVIAMFVEPRAGGTLKHIGLLDAAVAFDRNGPFHPSRMEPLEADTAGQLMLDVLDRSHGPTSGGTGDFRVLIAAARARSMVNQDGRKRVVGRSAAGAAATRRA
jgi:hypothetical protein